MKYLVDANVLIEAKNRYYAFDIAPGFWKWLDQAHAQGGLFIGVFWFSPTNALSEGDVGAACPI